MSDYEKVHMQETSTSINILYLNPAGYIGGAEKSLIDLVVNLPRKCYRPVVVSLGPGPLSEELRKRGIECEEIFLPSALRRLSREKGKNNFLIFLASPLLILPTVNRLLGLIRSQHIRIIHTNGIKAHLLGSVISFLTGKILIWHFRDFLKEGFYLSFFRLLSRIFPKKIIANSHAVKKSLEDLRKIEVVYNGLNLERFFPHVYSEDLRKKFGLRPDDLVIGTVGHFAPLKGYGDFVRAMPLILAKIPQAKFLIVGEAIYLAYHDYKEGILNLIDQLGLSEKVVCPGYRGDLPGILSLLDIFILPSWSEGFGRGNLEAMAAGKPVVSTRVGGIPEVVIDGETGYLVPPHDPGALARGIVKLARDQQLRDKMGRAGRKRAELFTVQKMVDGVIKVYDEVLSAPYPGTGGTSIRRGP